jgi:hypothetical protein
VNSQVDGGTSSTISGCVPTTTTDPNGPGGGDGSSTATDLLPGDYTCTVHIDP